MTAREIYPVRFFKPGENTAIVKDFRPIPVPSDTPEPVQPAPKAETTPVPTIEDPDPSSISGDPSSQGNSTGNVTPPAPVLPPPPIK